MRLLELYIERYKHLRNLQINFQEIDPLMGQSKFRFFIGNNGSGKSAALEALGLVLTRVVQDESPGFGFRIEYMVSSLGSQHRVFISNLKEVHDPTNGKFTVIINGQQLEGLFSDRTEYHPNKIIAQASGPTNILEDILIDSPIDSLKSDIYDVRDGADTQKSEDARKKEILDATRKLVNLKENPKYFFIDSMTAKFVLLVLCAIIPKQNREDYLGLRQQLFSVVGNFTPYSFSLVVDEDKYNQLVTSGIWTIPQQRFLQLVMGSEEKLFSDLPPLNDKVTITTSGTPDIGNNRIAWFLLKDMETPNFECEKVSISLDPLTLLSTLLIAKREGLLRDAHLGFRTKQESLMLTENSLSDGEYLWLARLGLALLFRNEENCLFLFDEPDLHLNESWIINFVLTLHKMTTVGRNVSRNEFIIATHSTLILTDATPGQLYNFKLNDDGTTTVSNNLISTFAANRGDITAKVFGTNGSVGTYSKMLIQDAIKNWSVDELRKLRQKVGPGYLQFLILDKITALEPPTEVFNEDDIGDE